MKHVRNITTVLLLSALAASGYADTGKSRSEVQAELSAAQHSGDIVSGESGLKLNELFPQRYSTSAVASTTSREQVKAELAQAVRNGDVVSGEAGLTAREASPQRYQQGATATASASAKTREQVKAELAEAVRNGDIVAGESGLTLADQFPQRYGKANATELAKKTDFARRASPSTAQ
jgi:hypothetical protein